MSDARLWIEVGRAAQIARSPSRDRGATKWGEIMFADRSSPGRLDLDLKCIWEPAGAEGRKSAEQKIRGELRPNSQVGGAGGKRSYQMKGEAKGGRERAHEPLSA